jgi:hypothetical protein
MKGFFRLKVEKIDEFGKKEREREKKNEGKFLLSELCSMGISTGNNPKKKKFSFYIQKSRMCWIVTVG